MILTVLLTATPDPQRGTTMPASLRPFHTLAASVARHGRRLQVLADCLPTGRHDLVDVHHVAPEPGANPYFRRWDLLADHIDAHAPDTVWCVDGTDTELLNPPPDGLTALHIGSEEGLTVGCPWMRSTNPDLADWIDRNADRPLLNPGIVGGPADVVARFARMVAGRTPTRDLTDMAAANHTAYTHLPDHVTGHPIHTPYRAHQTTGTAWWRHK